MVEEENTPQGSPDRSSAEMEAKFAPLYRELDHLDQEANLLSEARSEFEADRDGMKSASRTAMVAGLASMVEKVYTGCENLMKHVSRRLDNKLVEKSESWHRDLLDQMAKSNPSRTPFLSSESFQIANSLRAFRHRERSSYSAALHEEKVLENVGMAVKLPVSLRAETDKIRSDMTKIEDHRRRVIADQTRSDSLRLK